MPPENGTGDGTTNPQGQSTPSGLTTEEVNRIITSRNKDFETKLLKSFEGLLTSTLTGYEEKLAERFAPREAPASNNGGNEQKKATDSPEYVALKKQLEEQDKRTKAIEAERDAERKQRRDVSMRDAVKRELAQSGFTDAVRAELALGQLVDSMKAVRLDDDDDSRVLIKINGEELPLADGLRQWAKSDTAKFFLPPKGTNGSGGGPVNGRGGAPPTNGQMSRSQIGQAILGMSDDD